jgi:hypothetical protein
MAEDDFEEPEEDFEGPDEIEEDLEEELDDFEADIDEGFDDVVETAVVPVEAADEVEAETEDEETDEALEDLEAEELELMEDELAEVLLVDEAAELRAIRREELTMNLDAHLARADEFVCQSCFLVKRMSQLANRRKMYCLDCAS